MPKVTAPLSPSEPDPALLDTLDLSKRICLGAVALLALLTLAPLFIPPLGRAIPSGWQLIDGQ